MTYVFNLGIKEYSKKILTPMRVSEVGKKLPYPKIFGVGFTN